MAEKSTINLEKNLEIITIKHRVKKLEKMIIGKTNWHPLSREQKIELNIFKDKQQEKIPELKENLNIQIDREYQVI